ncbi:MAG: DNA recombination protein RmuC [Ruminococcus sp.]|nr:DNA recombination protein RmuC [Ruminococcus sp.]
MDTVFLIIGLIIIFLLLVILYKMWSPEDNEDIEKVVRESLEESQRGIRGDMNSGMQAFSRIITDNQNAASEAQQRQLMSLENRFRSMESSNNEKLEAMRLTMIRQLDAIQDENQKKLDAIQNTVNEKLETQLQQSFKLVSERLEKVYTSLGEMQSIASGVGDLKKVLSNVKTRGILGEIQLGNILEEILAPELYDREVPTIPNSRDHVEFAVKLPNGADGKSIYLPIDSKFPGDTYAALQDAYDSGDRERVAAAKKNLEIVIKKCAGDIRSKYVSPPYTTNFGIMFLPFEGLYAEAVNLGLVETLQRDYSVSIAGPSTMAAMLNSLQMGFRTLAIQKRSNEVWEVLGSVKAEFGTFADALEKTQKHIRQVDEDLEKLVGTRTRMINRKLSKVELPLDEGQQ